MKKQRDLRVHLDKNDKQLTSDDLKEYLRLSKALNVSPGKICTTLVKTKQKLSLKDLVEGCLSFGLPAETVML